MSELSLKELSSERYYLDRLIKDGAKVPVDKDVDSYELELPPWYDEKLFKRAQQFYSHNIIGFMAGMFMGLISVLAIPTILSVLTFTKQSSIPITAYKRYVATLLHTVTWFEYELKPGSKSWNSLAAVRKRHINVSKQSEKGKGGIISQKDIALTQFGFMGYIAARPELLGIQNVTVENLEAFTHFWRVLGYLLGVHDEFNVCTDSWATTRLRLELFLREVYRPNLENPPENFDEMTTALGDGIWHRDPMINGTVMVYFTKWITGCKGYDLTEENLSTKLKTWRNRYDFWSARLIHGYLLQFNLIRIYFNYLYHVNRFFSTYFPIVAIVKFGIKTAYVSILKNDKKDKSS